MKFSSVAIVRCHDSSLKMRDSLPLLDFAVSGVSAVFPEEARVMFVIECRQSICPGGHLDIRLSRGVQVDAVLLAEMK